MTFYDKRSENVSQFILSIVLNDDRSLFVWYKNYMKLNDKRLIKGSFTTVLQVGFLSLYDGKSCMLLGGNNIETKWDEVIVCQITPFTNVS